jgi:ferrous iron transport protein B
LRAKTCNYPGVTVGRSVGTTTVNGVTIAVEDLPGTYSLDPISPDEQVVTDLLAGEYPDIDGPDATCWSPTPPRCAARSCWWARCYGSTCRACWR